MKKILLSLGILAASASLCACGLFDKNKNDGNETPGGSTGENQNPNDNEEPGGTLPLPPDEEGGSGFPENEPSDGAVAVSFDAGSGKFSNGNIVVRVVPDANGKAVFTEQPLCDGCAFDGWYSDSVKYDPENSYSKGTVFSARYAEGSSGAVYTALFDEGSVVNFNINMTDAEWKKLNQDYYNNSKSDIYRKANNVKISVTSGGQKLTYYYEEVGVRLKGNTSRHDFYGNDGFYDAVHLKLSFKQTFDDTADGYTQDEIKVWESSAERKKRKKRTLGGMEKVDIKYNYTRDETYAKESYAMKLFIDNGIYAPRVTLCSVKALEKNERYKNLGVYTLHECVDEPFLLRNIESGSEVGDLYKCTWGSGNQGANLASADDWLIGVEDAKNRRFYTYDLKTNKKKSNHSAIKNFIQKANDYSSDLNDVFDTDYFAKFESVNYILGNPDCIRNHYNNYYLYFRKSDNKAIIIPFDYDRCLGVTEGWDPSGDAMSSIWPFSPRTTVDGYDRDNNQNPLYRRLIIRDVSDYNARNTFAQYLQQISASEALSASSFNAYKDNFKQKYSSYVSGAIGQNSIAFDGHTGNWSFERYMNTKLAALRSALENGWN